VHDLLVQIQHKLGYNSYEGVDISFDSMKLYLEDIYGKEGYSYHYNTDETSTIVKRGIIIFILRKYDLFYFVDCIVYHRNFFVSIKK